jgi:hypothetical protein
VGEEVNDFPIDAFAWDRQHPLNDGCMLRCMQGCVAKEGWMAARRALRVDVAFPRTSCRCSKKSPTRAASRSETRICAGRPRRCWANVRSILKVSP